MSGPLAGSVALITGSTSGIGRATCWALARHGAHVLVTGRNVARGDRVARAICSQGGRADFVAADLAIEQDALALAATSAKLGGGRVDILVNNAAIFPFAPTEIVTGEDFDTVFSTNVKAPYLLVAELAPMMVARRTGAIINILSVAAHLGTRESSLYGASKAALGLLTKAWAAEYAPHGVRVNAVSPGPTRSEGTTNKDDSMLHHFAAQTPVSRYAEVDEIANAIVFLASPEASYIHGAILAVDGGRTAV